MRFPMLTARRCRLTAILLSALAVIASAQLAYDTAWTFVYNGGMYSSGMFRGIYDNFQDVKVLPDGGCVCVGTTADTSRMGGILLMKLNASGAFVWKKFTRTGATGGCSIVLSKNGDFLIGGRKGSAPFIQRTDSLGNEKWSTWYYDSVNSQLRLLHGATVNCVRETSRGTIICAAGDDYPDNGGQPLTNWGVYLELDSAGNVLRMRQWSNVSGYTLGGFDIEEAATGNYLLSGNQAIYYIDTTGSPIWRRQYMFWLNGVGTVTNQVNRAKMLRNGTYMVAGMAYEGNCWTNYSTLYYDAWWSPLSISSGANTTWDTAGRQGGNDGLYDFTQLVNGNLVFAGEKAKVALPDSGVWIFVTDSTGANLLWEKQFNIPYLSDDGRALNPLSVCANADSGFTVVGNSNCVDALGGRNAFAAHFVLAMATPRLVRPINYEVNQPVSLTLVWTSVSNLTSYHIQIATTSDFSSITFEDSTLTDTSLVPSGLLNGTTYYWRVRAKGVYGTSPWSGYWIFNTIPLPPVTPTLVSPTDGAIAQNAPVTLIWSLVSGATSYHVQVARDTGFTDIYVRDSSQTGSQCEVTGFAYTTTYYWRVRAKNVAGTSAWSGYWSFTTNVAPPPVPTLVSPLNSATSQPVSLSLVWNLVSTATSYHVQVATNTGFTSIFTEDSTVTDTLKLISTLSNATTYYWRVRAKNSGSAVSAWATYRSFTTTIALPSAVTILSPADSAIIDIDTVRLSWHIAAPSVDRYLVEVATDSAMTSLVVQDSSVTDTTRLLTSLVNNVMYYWCIKAHNAAGWGSYSNETRFVTSFTGILYNGNTLRAFALRYSSGKLSYTLPSRCYVSVKYYDIRGRMVGSFVNITQGAGSHTLHLPLSSFTTGAYVQVFEAGEVIRKDRIMVVK